MGDILLFCLALLPFIIIFYLMVVAKKSAFFTMPFSFFLIFLLGIFIWKIYLLWLAASFIKGTFMAFEIILIVFFAIFLLNIYNNTSKIENIKYFLSKISEDVRVQAIVIAWFFVSFLEGVAGFGTPAALAAPLLVSLGFNPITAVVLALIGDSSAVSFGAAGTPILLGLPREILGLGNDLMKEVINNTALIHSIVATFLPLLMVFLIVFVFNKNQKSMRFFEMIPFSLFCGLSFAIPYYLVARFIGPELPSIFGSVFGFLMVFLAIKTKFLIPKNKLTFNHLKFKKNDKNGLIYTFSPYIILITFLLISRIILPVKNFLNSIYFGWNNIFGLNIGYTFKPFYTPSFYFFLACIFAILIFGMKKSKVKESLFGSLNKLEKPFIALIFALSFVQVLIISGNNSSGIDSIPIIIAEFISGFSGNFYIVLAPFIGALGAFITGSNTVSNLLFAGIQNQAAIQIGLSVGLILALQVVGGAIGNMIAIHNVLAAEATVKLQGKEGEIIGKTLIVALIYALIAGLIGFLIYLI